MKDLFTAASFTLKEMVKKLGTSIANAKVETLIKVGLSLGLTIAVVLFVIKFLKDKRASYTNEEMV